MVVSKKWSHIPSDNEFTVIQARRNRGTGGAALAPPQIFAIVGLLPIDNDTEKKKSIVKPYKPLKIARIILVTLLLSATCNAYN